MSETTEIPTGDPVEKPKTPAWFWIVAVLALLWNLLGLLGFGGTMMLMNSEQMLNTLPPEMQAYYTDTPAWATVAYAIAVFGGLFGAIALLIKQGAATILFILSLLGIIVSDIYSFAIAQVQSFGGAGSFVMPAIVLVVAAFLVWFSMMSKKKGYLR